MYGSLLHPGTVAEHGSLSSLGTFVVNGSLGGCGTLNYHGSLCIIGTLIYYGFIQQLHFYCPYNMHPQSLGTYQHGVFLSHAHGLVLPLQTA